MDILVPFSVRKREFGGTVPEAAKKLFKKIKDKPALAKVISLKGLPPRTTLHKLYATTDGGARRLLFFCEHLANETDDVAIEWVLLMYRDKGDEVGDNMSHRNAEFTKQFWKAMPAAIADVAADTDKTPRCELF